MMAMLECELQKITGSLSYTPTKHMGMQSLEPYSPRSWLICTMSEWMYKSEQVSGKFTAVFKG